MLSFQKINVKRKRRKSVFRNICTSFERSILYFFLSVFKKSMKRHVLSFQEYGDADPLTLAQVHEHLVRSPPPASWPNSTAFQFPSQDESITPGKNDAAFLKSPSKTPSHRGNDHELSRSETSTDIRGKNVNEDIQDII